MPAQYLLLFIIYIVYSKNNCIFHKKTNDSMLMINNNLMNLLYKNRYPIVIIPRELEPFEFELFFN